LEKDYNKELRKNIIGMGVRERYWENSYKQVTTFAYIEEKINCN
jgi:hypothetical protein